jgi:maltose-binding protein MalE
MLPLLEGSVDLWLDWSQDELRALNANLEDFQKTFPNVQISISYFPAEDLLEKFRQAGRENRQPALLIGPSEWGSALFAEGLIQDLQDRLLPQLVETILPVAWDGVRQGRSILGLPLTMQGMVLYRNAALVEKPAETLSELIELSNALEQEGYIGTLIDLGFFSAGAHLSACGGELLTDAGDLALTISAGECWLQILDDWTKAGKSTFNTEDDFDAFVNGQSAWLVDGSWKADTLIASLGVENIAIDPWPVYAPSARRLSGYAWTNNIYFGSSSRDQDFDVAWVLARYLLTQDVQLSLGDARSGRQFPVAVEAEFEEIWLQEMLVALREDISLPLYPQFEIFIELLEPAIFDVARRGYEPYWAMSFVYPKLERAIEAYARRN